MARVEELLRTEKDGTISFGDYTEVNFQISAPEDVNFTLELQPESEYEVLIGGASAGKMNTNLSGKLSVSVELGGDESTEVRIVKM